MLHPDVAEHCETWLASTVLGGYFASRLWERLRARHSRAYSPRSRTGKNCLHGGSFCVGGRDGAPIGLHDAEPSAGEAILAQHDSAPIRCAL